MTDIVSLNPGFDMGVQDTIVPKAANLLEVQIGDLSYAAAFGVDFAYFLTSNFQFQNLTFKAYLVGQMIKNQINVNAVTETIDGLFETFSWDVGDLGTAEPGVIV